jgi:diguanylate cyclase (GGDEF)-like protein/PAS domain S-box-containing protein
MMSFTELLLVALLLALVALGLSVAAGWAALVWQRGHGAALETSYQAWARHLADAAFDGLIIHQNGVILQMNNAASRMLGRRAREMMGQPVANLAPPEAVPAFRALLEAPPPEIAEFTLLRADQTQLIVQLNSQTISHEGQPATVTAIRDISQMKADQAQIARLLHYDALTDLPNRKKFTESLAAAIAVNDKDGGTTALFQIDLDQFKEMNERLGRAGGDLLLKQVADRMNALLGLEDMLARLGGDKFGLMVTSTGAPNRAVHLAGQLEAAVNQPFIVEGQLLNVSMSIGIAVYPDHATDVDGLMKAGEFALKQAGRAGGGFCHMFSHDEAASFKSGFKRDNFRPGLTDPQRLAQDLRGAIAAGEITLVYQPVFRAADLSLTGFEALARWQHKQDGMVPPGIFIPLAEQAGLIHEIGAFVLETACAEAMRHEGNLKMAVNLSPLQLRDADLPGRIKAILLRTGLPASRLELEVTEKLLIDNAPAAARSLQALRAIGVSLALDDFGTGYSSVSYLCDFPFARLKIDRRFINALGEDENAEAIISAILALAGNLRLEVTAEGVETEAQLTFLRTNAVHHVQGFLLGQPAATASVAAVSLPRGRSLPALPALVNAAG